MTNEKHFLKTISQWEFDYGLFTNLLRIIVVCDFSPSSFKLTYLSWQNRYLTLKTTCKIKLKFFLWTKLLKRLLFAKYLISVAETLMKPFESTWDFFLGNFYIHEQFPLGIHWYDRGLANLSHVIPIFCMDFVIDDSYFIHLLFRKLGLSKCYFNANISVLIIHCACVCLF